MQEIFINGFSFTSIPALVQGVYFLLTGIWPILSRRSFEFVTGPKVDFWLVRTIIGLWIAALLLERKATRQ